MAAATADFNEGRGVAAGHVYFVGGDEGPIKIGHSADLHKRLRAIKNTSPVAVRLLAAVPGDRSTEAAYHRRFAACREHGEWFARTPELLAEIRSIATA